MLKKDIVLQLIERDRRCFNPNRLFPELFLSEGEGIVVKDIKGNTYLDFITTSCVLGHRHPEVIRRIKDQLEKLIHFYGCWAVSEPFIELAEKLKEVMPPNLATGKVSYGCSGTEVVDYSVKLARHFTKKSVIISHHGCHHGHGGGVFMFTSEHSSAKVSYRPSVIESVHVPYPYCYRCAFGQKYPECNLICLEYIERVFDMVVPPENVSAILLEPMQSWNGVVVPPDEYMSKLKEICDKNQILIIDDEVFVGFGRTGKMFGIQNWDIKPDIMCLGKAIGGGMTGSNAIVAGKDMVDSWPDHWGGQVSSAAGNLLACAASIAVLDVIRKENLVDNAKRIGQILMKGARELSSKYELIGDVRGKGLLVGIELVKDRRTKKPAIGKPIEVAHKALKKGLLIEAGAGTYRNILRLIPPLVVTEEHINKALEILDKSFMEAK